MEASATGQRCPWGGILSYFCFLEKLSVFHFFSPGLSLTINRNDQKESPEATPCYLVRGSSHGERTRKSWTLVSSLEWEPYLSEKAFHRFSPLGKDEVKESSSWGEIREYSKPSVEVPAWGWDLIISSNPIAQFCAPCTARLTSFRNKSQQNSLGHLWNFYISQEKNVRRHSLRYRVHRSPKLQDPKDCAQSKQLSS